MPMENVVSTHVERLPVKLSPEEFHQKATRVAQIHGELEEHVSQTKSLQAIASARKKELEARISQLTEAMRTGIETRDVNVDVVFDAGEALEIRRDLGEVVRKRPISQDEQQHKLFTDAVNEQAEEPEEGEQQ